MPGKNNIFGRLENNHTDIWIYKGQKGGEIVSPITGNYDLDSDSSTGIFTYTNEGCEFIIYISPISNHVNMGGITEGQKIGNANNEQITLKIKKGSNFINPNDFFNGKDECFKTKKEENKKENNKREEDPYYNKSNKSNQIASSDDFDFIYKNAAFPFKIFSLKTGIKEEVERIKQLMK